MSEPTPDSPPQVDADGALSWTVPSEEAGRRLDRVLGRCLAPAYSRSYLTALIQDGRITLNERVVKPSFRLEGGETLAGQLGESAAGLPRPEAMDLEIVHEDEHLIVVNKPVGLIIHPGGGTRSGTLVNGLLERYPELATVGRAERPGIVHRLDRETSGVLLVARTNDAARSLVLQFKAKTIKKEYAAFVWGELPFDSDWIDLPLGPNLKRPPLRAVCPDDGQPASTFYEVRARYGIATRLAVFPATGRTHQIRVHLEHLGFPVIADPQYGRQAREAFGRWKRDLLDAEKRLPVLQRQALHAHKITFTHPGTEEVVTFEAPLPADLEDLREVLEAQ
ncbi:MAG: ribosomal large subunit pseudouridine synthase D [Planctomycetota bacterium]|nr:MAG: ribosomal large subunit pseudouridine synthase D [Planctomycetota bacterium]